MLILFLPMSITSVMQISVLLAAFVFFLNSTCDTHFMYYLSPPQLFPEKMGGGVLTSKDSTHLEHEFTECLPAGL